jgi:hypothetical protein
MSYTGKRRATPLNKQWLCKMQTLLEVDLGIRRKVDRVLHRSRSLGVVAARVLEVLQYVLAAVVLAMSGSICTNQM